MKSSKIGYIIRLKNNGGLFLIASEPAKNGYIKILELHGERRLLIRLQPHNVTGMSYHTPCHPQAWASFRKVINLD